MIAGGVAGYKATGCGIGRGLSIGGTAIAAPGWSDRAADVCSIATKSDWLHLGQRRGERPPVIAKTHETGRAAYTAIHEDYWCNRCFGFRSPPVTCIMYGAR